METKKLLSRVALAITLGVMYTGCDKTKDPKALLDTDTSSASDNSTADGAFSGIFKSVSQAADSSSGLKAGGCAIITTLSTGATTWPKKLTIDFGTSGCDGKKGKIIAYLTAPFRTTGAVLTISTVDFYDGANKVDAGTHTITNNGNNSAGNLNFSIDVAGATVTTTSGVISWSTTRTIEWSEGSSTPLDQSDDVFLISGQASGTSAKGDSFTAAITTPLRIAVSCQYIESGVVTLTPKGKPARTIDFGTSGCDNKAKVSVNGIGYDITM
jgi:hypothetical protein